MKAQIYSMLEAKNTDDQIKQHLVSRYSEFVLYRPEVNTPYMVSMVCTSLFCYSWSVDCLALCIFSKSNQTTNHKTTELSEKQQQQLSQLLGEEDKL